MLNHSILIGRIGTELVLRTTNSGTEVLTFRLAVKRDYNKEITDWINIVAWKGTASIIAKNFKIGDMICVEGSIQTGDYEDKDGKKVYTTDVNVNKVHFVTDKREANTNTNTDTNTSTFTESADDEFMPIGDSDNLPWEH